MTVSARGSVLVKPKRFRSLIVFSMPLTFILPFGGRKGIFFILATAGIFSSWDQTWMALSWSSLVYLMASRYAFKKARAVSRRLPIKSWDMTIIMVFQPSLF